MLGGDISNDAPASVLCNIDVILAPQVEISKVFGLFPKTTKTWSIDLLAVNALHRISTQSSVSWEGFTTELDDEEVASVESELDRLGINPFRWIVRYEDVSDLMAQLPFRRSVLGIIDRPERGLTYGSYYVDLDTVYGR